MKSDRNFIHRSVSAAVIVVLMVLNGVFLMMCTGCTDHANDIISTTDVPFPESPQVVPSTTIPSETEPPQTDVQSVFPWENSSVVFVGDSITAGTGTTKTYHDFLRESELFRSVRAMGVGGSCISSRSDYGSKNSPLSKRYASIPRADLVVIFMGSNDYGHETPLGSISDTTDISFYGALDTVISGTIERHPNSQLVFVTPLHRFGFGESKILGTKFTYDYSPNGRGHTLGDYVNAIKAVCAKYSVPVIDLYTLLPINPEVSADRTAYFPDGLHPNAAGHGIIAKTILENLRLIPNRNLTIQFNTSDD